MVHASQYEREIAFINNVILHHHSSCCHSHHRKEPEAIRHRVYQCLNWISDNKYSNPVCLDCPWQDITQPFTWHQQLKNFREEEAIFQGRQQNKHHASSYYFSGGSGTGPATPCAIVLHASFMPQDLPSLILAFRTHQPWVTLQHKICIFHIVTQ